MTDDFKYIGYVLLACFVYMIVHTRSVYFTVVSLLNVAMGIPISLVILIYVFQVTYFSSLHLSVIIIIIGIGSDNVFVFHDFWKSNFKIKAIKERTILRLTYTYRKAFKSMFLTSFTTAVMFLSCVLSSIMPIRSFAIFAATTVPIVFIQTVIVQPLLYYLHEKYWMNNCFNSHLQLNFDPEPIVEIEDDTRRKRRKSAENALGIKYEEFI